MFVQFQVGGYNQFYRPVVFKLFWVPAHLQVFDLTAAHLELMHQTYSSAFILLDKKISIKHCYLERTMQSRKIQKYFNVNAGNVNYHCKVNCPCKEVIAK